ncbi:MAG: OPT family oligopeptide transporter [Tepidisphaerales bacterium]
MEESNQAPVPAVSAEIPALPPNATPEEKDAHWFKYVYQGDRMPQLTVRAVLMGGILGMLMSASNLYTTLAVGWGFGVAITACVMSYVIWNVLRYFSGGVLAGVFAILGLALVFTLERWLLWNMLSGRGKVMLVASTVVFFAFVWFFLRNQLSQMSLLENNCMASTASAAGYSTGATIATMFGALVLLTDPGAGQTSVDIKTWNVQPVWVVALFTCCTGLMGVFLAVPMKRQMINHEQLRFPSGVAAAETLRSLCSKSREAVLKAYALVTGIGVGAIVGILNTGEGSLKTLDRAFDFVRVRLHMSMRLPDLYPAEGFFQLSGKELPSFGFEPSLLLIAAGVITRLRVSLSMLAGSALLYFVFAPYLVHLDQQAPGSGWSKSGTEWTWTAPPKPKEGDKTKETILNIPFNSKGTVLRVTTWALWGGTAVMVFSSLTAIALQWKTIARAFGGLKEETAEDHTITAMKKIEVPTSWMIAGMIPVTLAMLCVQIIGFHISWWAGLIAIAMSFFLSLVACRATGETDTTPIGAMGKVMQLTFAVLHPRQIIPNLAAAGIAANSASSSADLLTDLKSGYLLGANPRKQFLAQFFGLFFGTLAIVPFWFLMVPTRAKLDSFAAPATRQWEAVARVLTKGIDQLPRSAQVAILLGALVGVGLPLLERVTPEKLRKYLPSAMGLGLSWVIPFANALAFALGAFIGWVWERLHRKSADDYSIALSSGLIAGESLMKAIIAMMATASGLLWPK